MHSSIAIIVPAFNEEKTIANVVQSLNKLVADNHPDAAIVVVNDCSTDRTAAIAETLPCTLLNLPVNLGIGGAMQTGFRYAFEKGFEYAIQVDGDGQHPANEIPKLVAAIQKQPCDIVIGSRFISKEGFQSSVMRRAGIAWFRWLNKLLVGVDIKDSTSGFRLSNRKAIALFSENYPDEYPEPEAIIIAVKNGLTISEVAISMKDRQGGTSSIGFFSGIYYMWKVTLGILFNFIRASRYSYNKF